MSQEILIPYIRVFEYSTRGHETSRNSKDELCVVLRNDKYLKVRRACRINGIPLPKGSEIRQEGGMIVIR